MSEKVYGLIAEFDSPAAILHAAEKVRDAGYRKWDAFTPFPIHGMDKVMKLGNSLVEWYAHYPLALKASLSQQVADDLKAGIRPRNMKPDEEVVYDVSMEMVNNHQISDALFQKSKAILGEQQLVDLVAVSGTYVTVAMLLALGQEMPPPGKPLPFP